MIVYDQILFEVKCDHSKSSVVQGGNVIFLRSNVILNKKVIVWDWMPFEVVAKSYSLAYQWRGLFLLSDVHVIMHIYIHIFNLVFNKYWSYWGCFIHV